jgi:hypothetical protein
MPYLRITGRLLAIGMVGLGLAVGFATGTSDRPAPAYGVLVVITIVASVYCMARWAFRHPYRDFEVRLRPRGGVPRRPSTVQACKALALWTCWIVVRIVPALAATYVLFVVGATVVGVAHGVLAIVGVPVSRTTRFAESALLPAALLVAVAIAAYQAVESLFGARIHGRLPFDPGTRVGGASLGLFRALENVFEDSAAGQTFRRRKPIDPAAERLYAEWVHAEEARRQAEERARHRARRSAAEESDATAELARAYELFGLQPGAGASAVKRAYRRLAMKHHPDRNPADPQAEARMTAINAALALLEVAEDE